MNYGFISSGGLGDFVIHADVLRQAMRLVPQPRACYAAPAAAELGRIMFPALNWRSDAPSLEDPHDFFVELKWFTTAVSPEGEIPAAIIPDRACYEAFEQARAEGAIALAAYFGQGLSMRAILCRSWGFVEDEMFVRLEVAPNARCLRPYVVIANGADRPWPVADRQTKQLPRGLLTAIVAETARRLPGVRLIEVGLAENTPGVPGTLDLRGATTIADLIGLVAGARTVLCIEGGLAHICAAMQKRAIVLTGPTSAAHYGHVGHTYLRSEICSPCAWSVIDWYARCPKALNAACMSAFDPQSIAEQIALEVEG